MAYNIADAMVALTLVEQAVSVVVGGVPFATKVARVWPLPASQVFPDTPAFIHSVIFSSRQSGSALRDLRYTARCQLFIEDADLDRGLEAAFRMHSDLLDRLDHNLTLKDAGGQPTVTRIDYRGADPTFGTGERAGRTFQMMDMNIDMMIQTAWAYS